MFKALKNFFSGKSNQESTPKAAIASMESQLSRIMFQCQKVPPSVILTHKLSTSGINGEQILKFPLTI